MTKAKYVDGYVLAVPKGRTAEYRKMAKEGAKMWMKFGALDYMECMGDDLKPKPGMSKLDFSSMVKAKKGETVWFSFVTYKSKAHRDQVNKKVMAHFAKQYDEKNLPKWMTAMRMAVGGFKVEVSG